MIKSLKPLKAIKPRKFKDPNAAFDAVEEIYDTHVEYLRRCFSDFGTGLIPGQKISTCYPYVKVMTETASRADTRLSYGFVPRPGTYMTTVTRPDLFGHYLREQMRLLVLNHDCPIEVGVSDTPIPIHFALGDDYHLERQLNEEQIHALPLRFEMPDLAAMDDEIANNTFITPPGNPRRWPCSRRRALI